MYNLSVILKNGLIIDYDLSTFLIEKDSHHVLIRREKEVEGQKINQFIAFYHKDEVRCIVPREQRSIFETKGKK